MHGSTNSVCYFQSSIEYLFGHLAILIWLDDLLGYAKTPQDLLELLCLTLQICLESCLKLNPHKCQLVACEVPFCGRIIDAEGVKFNPQNYEALSTMSTPTTVGSLMDLVYGAK